MTRYEVIRASQPRDPHHSKAAARFDVGRLLSELGEHAAAIDQWTTCHELQPENWTGKRQAWSLVGDSRSAAVWPRFIEGPVPAREDEWPCASSFRDDVAAMDAGQYCPKTM
jgi:hypothetical protein